MASPFLIPSRAPPLLIDRTPSRLDLCLHANYPNLHKIERIRRVPESRWRVEKPGVTFDHRLLAIIFPNRTIAFQRRN